MRNLIVRKALSLGAALAAAGTLVAGPRVTVIGDSISTYNGTSIYPSHYPQGDVNSVDKTWWMIAIKEIGGELACNAAWTASRVAGTSDSAMSSDYRLNASRLGTNPDLFLICAGTNDGHDQKELGEFQYDNLAAADATKFRPAFARILDFIKTNYPQASIMVVVNTKIDTLMGITDEQWEPYAASMETIAAHYGAMSVRVHDVGRIVESWAQSPSGQLNVHPNAAGMKTMAQQVVAAYTAVKGSGEGFSASGDSELRDKGQSVSPTSLAIALPKGFTQLEYVTFTGRQYVDLGYTPTSASFGFCLDYTYKAKVSSQAGEYRPVFGSSKANSGLLGGVSLSGWAATDGGQMSFCKAVSSGESLLNPHIVPEERQCLTAKGGLLKVTGFDDTDISGHTVGSLFYNAIYLGAVHLDTTEPKVGSLFMGDIYRFSVYEGESVVADFVPARSDDGRIGFYDVVGIIGFRGCATETPLVPGPDVIPSGDDPVQSETLPEGYDRLAYVAFTGEQYVDTLVTPTSAFFGFDLDLVCESKIVSSGAKHILGSTMKNGGGLGGIAISTWQQYSGGQMSFCGVDAAVDPMLTPNARQQLTLRNGLYATSNGSGTKDLSSHTDISNFSGNLYMGAIHYEDGPSPVGSRFLGKVYRLSLYNGVLRIADYLPARAPNGEIGLYDVVGTNGFRVSATVTPLEPGPALAKPDSLAVASSVEGVCGFSPATANYSGLKVGNRIVVTASGKVKRPDGTALVCAGWRLYDAFGALIDSQASRRFAYVHQKGGDIRRLVWQWAKYDPGVAVLPEGYAPVEFVASEGRQFVDTGLAPDATTRVVCDMRYPAGYEQGLNASMGWGNAASGDTFFWGYRETFPGYFCSSVGSTWAVKSTGVPVDDKRHVFDIGPGCQKLDGGEPYATDNPSAVIASKVCSGVVPNIMLYGMSVGWNPALDGFASSAEIYGVQIYRGGDLVADLRPAICLERYGEADGVGFYDLVRKTFLTGQHSTVSADLSINGKKTPSRLTDGIRLTNVVLPAPSGLVMMLK